MTKFIHLHEANGRKCELLLNVDHIGSIQSGNDSDRYVRMVYNTVTAKGEQKTEYYFVKETFEEIKNQLIVKNDSVSKTIIDLKEKYGTLK